MAWHWTDVCTEKRDWLWVPCLEPDLDFDLWPCVVTIALRNLSSQMFVDLCLHGILNWLWKIYLSKRVWTLSSRYVDLYLHWRLRLVSLCPHNTPWKIYLFNDGMNLWLHEPDLWTYIFTAALQLGLSHWTVLTIDSGLNYSLSNNWPWIELPL